MTNRTRAAMVRHLSAAIRHRGLTDPQAAAWLQVSEAKIQALRQADIEAFTLAELETMAQAEAPRPVIPAERQFVLYERLQPRTDWRGGRIADVDLLTLEEAARMATRHAGEDVTPADFLRAAGRGEIILRAIVHRAAKVRRHDGGVLFNKGREDENIVPVGSIPTLPLVACQHLANTGRASWRTFDGLEEIDGNLMRYTMGTLTDDEPDFETVPADCRVSGYDVHALADAFCDEQPPAAPAGQRATAETPQERRARWLAMFEEEQKRGPRGALQRLAKREGVDRSNMKKDIDKAREARDTAKRSGGWTSQLVRDGKHTR